MKIKQVHVRASKIKLKETFTIALGTIESADSAIVEIETEEGLVGYGEHYNNRFVNQSMTCVVFE